MELVLAKPPEAALTLLGQPRLDRREGTARQLQFAGACVLDIWYYPKSGPELSATPGPSATPGLSATHADARLVDGRNYAAGECLQMLINANKPPAILPTATPARKPAQRRRG
jgi:hypothetical protein